MDVFDTVVLLLAVKSLEETLNVLAILDVDEVA